MEKIWKFVSRCIGGTYTVLVGLAILSSVFLLDYFTPGTSFMHFLPLTGVCWLGVWMWWKRVGCRRDWSLSDRRHRWTYALVVVGMAVLQWVVAYYYPFTYKSDHALVKDGALALASVFDVQSSSTCSYMLEYRMNCVMSIVLSFIVRLFGSYNACLFIGALLTNLSAVFTGLTVRNLTRSNVLSVVALLVSEVLLGFCFHAYVPYTHNYAIMFPALCMYFYTSRLPYCWKVLAVVLPIAVGIHIRLTVIIPLVAIILVELARCFRHTWRQWAYGALVTLACFSATSWSEDRLLEKAHWEFREEYNTPFVFGFVMGQCNESQGKSCGHCYGIKYDLSKSYEERERAFYEVMREAIRSRGFWGNVKFYLTKMSYTWGDSTFSSYKVECKNKRMQPFLYLYTLPRQILWLSVLGLMMLIPFYRFDDRSRFFQLSLIGVMLYLLAGESESRYVFVFASFPIVLGMMGLYALKVQDRGDSPR